MKKLTRLPLPPSFWIAALCAGLLLLAVGPTTGLAETVPVEVPGFSVDASMADNLKAWIGKNVTVHVEGGTQLSGTIKAVGPELVHLEKLDGKEYYDALILIEEIVALDARFREFKR